MPGSHCLKLNMGLLRIIEHQWCDFTNPMICYTVEYTLVLEFGSLAPMFEPFSKGYPCTRFFQGMKEQMRLVLQMLRDINMVEGARFTLHQTRLILQIWLVDTCGCNATEARFPMETSFQLLVLAVCSAWATAVIVTMTMLKKWRKHEELWDNAGYHHVIEWG